MLFQSLTKANLLEVSLSNIIGSLEENYQTNLKPSFTPLFLESLILFSLVLYRKSELILKTYFHLKDERFDVEEPQLTDDVLPFDFKECIGLALPVDRLLEDKIFLPRIEGLKFEEERLTVAHLIKPLLKMLEKESYRLDFEVEAPKEDISFYLERVENFLVERGKTTFSEILELFEMGILTVVYLFLSILFLAFEGKIRVFPLEDDLEIIVQVF